MRRLTGKGWPRRTGTRRSSSRPPSSSLSPFSQTAPLHNVSGSVLIFDEAQSLPVRVLRPCLYAVSQLVKHFGCTAVLCTATQPELNRIFAEPLFYPGGAIRELCPGDKRTDDVFRRVRYEDIGPTDDDALTEALDREPQSLCIVNTIRHAQKLFERSAGGDGCFCLTTRLTPRSRKSRLDEIRRRLRDGLPCRVVSTSLIEAGVDVDFPAVYRELSGLDSMIQAGGRCNRENRRPAEESVVRIFESGESVPPFLRKNIEAAKRALRTCPDISSPEAVSAYFDFLLYQLKDASSLDEADILGRIPQGMPFAGIAEDFRIIDSGDCSVAVPCPENNGLLGALRHTGPTRGLLRMLGPDTVSLRRRDYQAMLDAGHLEPIGENLSILADPDLYDADTGLKNAEESELIF